MGPLAEPTVESIGKRRVGVQRGGDVDTAVQVYEIKFKEESKVVYRRNCHF